MEENVLTDQHEPLRNPSGGGQDQLEEKIYRALRWAKEVSERQNDLAEPIEALASDCRRTSYDFILY